MSIIRKNTTTTTPCLLLPVLLVVLLALYTGLRFNWHWLAGDAIALTEFSQSLFEDASLTVASSSYRFGYGYPALNVFLAHITGSPIADLQLHIQPFLVALLVPTAFLAFNSLIGRPGISFLATLVLILQPEFLFEAVRSSHAKVTYLMALSMVFILAASLRSEWGTRTMIKWVLLFYAVAYAMICSNSFFASNYIFSLALAFLGAYGLKWLRRGGAQATGKLHRLLFITLACGILVFLFLFYLYPPAMEQINELPTILDRVAALLFDVETEAANPYGYVGATWTSPGVYFALTLLSWVVLGVSFLGWVVQTRQLLLRRQEPETSQLLLWLFYAAFAFLLAVSVLLDFASVLSENMQVRIFPNFMVFAIPMACLSVVNLIRRLQAHPSLRSVAIAALVVMLAYYTCASLLKVTNEPLLSNNWWFFTPDERQVLTWVSDRQQQEAIWAGFGRRLELLSNSMPGYENRYLYRFSLAELELYREYIPYLLMSDLTVHQSARMGRLLPDLRQDTFRVYDNGGAVIYKDKPLTPYKK